MYLFELKSDVSGHCETNYTVKSVGWNSMTIKKSKNLLGCNERQGAQSSIQGIPYTSSSVRLTFLYSIVKYN